MWCVGAWILWRDRMDVEWVGGYLARGSSRSNIFDPNHADQWLRSRMQGGCLHADEDAVGVSLSSVRASLRSACTVYRVLQGEHILHPPLQRRQRPVRTLALSAHLAPERATAAARPRRRQPGQAKTSGGGPGRQRRGLNYPRPPQQRRDRGTLAPRQQQVPPLEHPQC